MGRLGVAALAACLALALVGCESEPEPRLADPTSEPTSEPTAVETSEVTAPPTSPPSTAVTEEPEPLGPEETVRAWVNAFNRLLTTGDAADLSALSAEGCDACNQVIRAIEPIYESGGSTETRGWEPQKVERTGSFSRDGRVAVDVRVFRAVTVEGDGTRKVAKATRFLLEFTLERTRPRSWLVTEWGYL